MMNNTATAGPMLVNNKATGRWSKNCPCCQLHRRSRRHEGRTQERRAIRRREAQGWRAEAQLYR